jgi:DHA1 family bicyclomycin/chloramphenicol resistance-like MFS transporter
MNIPWSLVALLAAMSTISPFATDTYVPALHAVGASLDATQLEVQQTLSAYMLGLGLMSLWHGAISDALGRRPVILAALGVFSAASLGCALATSVHTLILMRLAQGLSGGAGMVIVRAVVRDSVQGPAAQRLMSRVMLMFGIAPAIAPVLGGYLHGWFGWRSIFWFLFAFGATLTVWVALRLPETLPPARRHSLHPLALLRSFREIFSSGRFLLLALTTGCAFQVFMQYIGAATAFLHEQLGLAETEYAWFFLPVTVGYVGGSMASGILAGRLPARRTIWLSLLLMLAAGIESVLWHAFEPPGIFASIAPIVVATFGLALLAPATQLLVLDLFPTRLGTASSCLIFVQIMMGTLDLGVVSIAVSDSPFTLSLALVGWVLVSIACWQGYRVVRRRVG